VQPGAGRFATLHCSPMQPGWWFRCFVERMMIMSVKPVDFQVQIPKTNEVSKIISDERHKNDVVSQQQTQLNQNKAQDSVSLVHSQDNTQKSKINEKQNKNSKEKKEKGNKKRTYNNDSSLEEEQTSTIDIRL